eukprot:3104532-Alexandrium_andersonii.AAC.1
MLFHPAQCTSPPARSARGLAPEISGGEHLHKLTFSVRACLPACVPSCLRACVPACLRACVPAC